MARPPKDPALRMDVDLRIPVTVEQKRLISQAAAIEQIDVAAWVRPILVRSAHQTIKRKIITRKKT